MIADKPKWDASIPGTHPALADLTISNEELDRAHRNNQRIQAELAEARGGIGGGLGSDLEFINQQERLVASFAAQLAHWQDESLKVETKTWLCPNGHSGGEWIALEPFTIDVQWPPVPHPRMFTKQVRVESRHGQAACPECGSSQLAWTSTENKSDRVHAARRGLATALYRLSRFDEALAAIPGEPSLLAERIHTIAHAVSKPDDERCDHVGDYQECDRLYSALHGAVLSALKCPRCEHINVTPFVDTFQP